MKPCRGWLASAVVCCVVVATAHRCAAQEDTEGAQLRRIPDYIKICYRNDPQLNACITKSVEIIRPYLIKGIPELDVPTIEPLLMREIVAVQGGGIRIRATEVKAYGCSDFDIHSMAVNFDNGMNEIKFVLDFPMLYINAQYRVDGRILLLPVYGSGPLKANFTECRGDVTLQGRVVDREDGRYFHVENFKVKIKVGDGSIHLQNLFGGDPVLGNVVNSVLNNNFDTFVREIIPSIESALSNIMMEIANNVVSKFSYDQLFPAGPALD